MDLDGSRGAVTTPRPHHRFSRGAATAPGKDLRSMRGAATAPRKDPRTMCGAVTAPHKNLLDQRGAVTAPRLHLRSTRENLGRARLDLHLPREDLSSLGVMTEFVAPTVRSPVWIAGGAAPVRGMAEEKPHPRQGGDGIPASLTNQCVTRRCDEAREWYRRPGLNRRPPDPQSGSGLPQTTRI